MVDKKDVKKLAELARIEMTEEQIESATGDFGDILEYISVIQSVAADEPNEEDRIGLLKNVMREDENPTVRETHTEDMVRRAPQSKDNYFKVKKILS